MTEQLARAVQHAHQQGIVHRDLKPANILLLDANSNGPEAQWSGWVPKITDFGLAKQLERMKCSGPGEGPTGTSAVLGTPAYMAPEQARGDSKQIGPAADIWALGATLYEMLTGNPPFQGRSVAEILLQVTEEEPAAPRQLQPGVPRDLETICLKCLAKLPERRYASADDLADDLQRFLGGLPIQARPVGRVERVVKWSRRRPALAGLLGLVCLLPVALLGVGLWLADHESSGRRLAEELTVQAEEARAQAEIGAREAERLRELEAERRRQADLRRDQALQESENARLELADQALDRGIELCARQGDVRQGLLWLARSLELTQVAPVRHRNRAAVLERAARLNLTAWSNSMPARVVHLLPHAGGVESASFHPSRPLVATGGRDGSVRLWEKTGQPIGAALSHTGPVRCLAWSRDGKFLAVGTGDGWQADGPRDRTRGEVCVWEVANGRLRIGPLKHNGTVWAVDLSPDGQLLLTGCHDRQARLWSLTSSKPLASCKHSAPVTGAAFLGDGTRFVTTTCANGYDSWPRIAELRTWDTARARPLGPVFQQNHIRALGVLPDGTVEAERRKPSGQQIPDGLRRSASTAVMPDGTAEAERRKPSGQQIPDGLRRSASTAVTGSNNSEIQFWDLKTGAAGAPLVTGAAVTSLGVSRDGSVIVAAGADYRVRIFDRDSGQRIGPDLYAAAPLQTVALAPDGRSFLSGDSYSARLWRLDRAAATDVPLRTAGPIKRLMLNETASHVLVEVEPGGALQLWNASTGQPAGKAFRPARGVSFLDLSRDARTALVVAGNVLQAFRADTGEPAGKEITVGAEVMDARISPDGRLAAVGGRDMHLHLIDLQAGKLLGKVAVNNLCGSVFFVPDGKSVLAGTWRLDRLSVRRPDPGASRQTGCSFRSGQRPGVHDRWSDLPGRRLGAKALHPGPDRTGADARGAAPAFRRGRSHHPERQDRIHRRRPDTAPVGHRLRQTGRAGPAPSRKRRARAARRSAEFADDHTLVGIVRSTGMVRRWSVPDPMEGSPAHLVLSVQSLTGMSLDTHGGLSILSVEDWQRIRQQLNAAVQRTNKEK